MVNTLSQHIYPQTRITQAIRRIVAPQGLLVSAILLSTCLTLTMILVGVSLDVSLRLSFYIWFVMMPYGFVAARILFGDNKKILYQAGLGVGISQLILPLTVIPFYVLEIVDAHVWFACIGAAIVWVIEIARKEDYLVFDKTDYVNFWLIVVATTVIAVVCFLSVSNGISELGHFRIQVLDTYALESGWPPESVYVAGIPYKNNYGVHLSIWAIARGTSVSIANLGGYVIQIAYLWLAIFNVGIVGRVWLRLSPGATIAALVACFFILGYSPINTYIYGSAQSTAAMKTLSPLLGEVGFLLSLMLFATAVLDRGHKQTKAYLFSLLVLSAATMFARANAGALLGVSVASFWLLSAITTRTLQFKTLIHVAAIGLGCVAALIFSLGSPTSSQFSGTGFLAIGPTPTLLFISGNPVAQLVRSMGLSAVVGGAVAYFVFVLVNASYLSPFFWVRASSILLGKGSISENLLFCSFGMGVIFSLITFAPGGSNFVFLQLAKIGMCLIGAKALDEVLSSWKSQKNKRLSKILLFLGCAMGIVHFYDAAQQAGQLKPFRRIMEPSQIEALQGGRFDLAPIIKQIQPSKNTRFIIAYRDQNLWGYFGRVSTAMVEQNIKLLTGDMIRTYANFTTNRLTDSIANQALIFEQLEESVNKGKLDLPCVVEMARNTLGHDLDVYLLSEKNLQVVSHPSVTLIGGSKDLDAWHVSPGKNVAASCAVN